MNARERLPQRRQSEVFGVRVDRIDYSVTVGRYPDGRIGEVFISCHKAGSTVAHLARDAAVLLSIALQHGAPLNVIADALTREEGGAAAGLAGAVGDEIKRLEATPWAP